MKRFKINENSFKLTRSEAKLSEIIWENEPLSSTKLVRLSEMDMEWSKSTTYTVLKKLCEKGIFRNERAIVSALITRDEFITGKSRLYVKNTFDGSLSRFLVSYFGDDRLTAEQSAKLKSLIEECEEGGDE
ncbi:MAG: BlaI/MecI/CopY family transcriptional regulator [Oscillospiraceae bacterium]|nr:BlaI/MecI/CopY family transcriptional regulator [Oscillospiraceae bacterium]